MADDDMNKNRGIGRYGSLGHKHPFQAMEDIRDTAFEFPRNEVSLKQAETLWFATQNAITILAGNPEMDPMHALDLCVAMTTIPEELERDVMYRWKRWMENQLRESLFDQDIEYDECPSCKQEDYNAHLCDACEKDFEERAIKRNREAGM